MTALNQGTDMTESNIWFALANDGEMYCLCDCGDMEAAEESAKDLGIEAVWIGDQQAAEQWQARLNQNLPQFGDRENATILTALRLLEIHLPSLTDGLIKIQTDGGTLEPLDSNEIDDLCERINQ